MIINKKLFTASLAIILMASSVGFAAAKGYGGHGDDGHGNDDHKNKVEICHNGNTIEVAKSAVAAHLAHGDKLGECAKADKNHYGDHKDNGHSFGGFFSGMFGRFQTAGANFVAVFHFPFFHHS